MRTLTIVLISLLSFLLGFGQGDDSAGILIKQGIALHDEKDYEGAIKLYDEALKKEPNNFLAHYEKSLSLYVWGKFEDCIDICKNIIKQFPKEELVRETYVNYGSSLDALGKPDEAIKVYTEGIKKFPQSYLLYFNRGVTHSLQKDMEKAAGDFKQSVSLNPAHASSHQGLAYCVLENNKIAAAMALSAFLAIEPEGKRAEKNLALLLKLLGSNVKKTDDKQITISLSADALDNRSKGQDDFSSMELLMSMSTALDLGEEKKDKSNAEKLKDKFELIASIVPDKKKNKRGFFTNFYLPFFKQMREAGHLETLSYLALLSSGAQSKNWLHANSNKLTTFYEWLENYEWIKKD